jgi:hypothetical protein
LIPADRSHYAIYENTKGRQTARRPVIAWDDDGHPLVVGPQGLRRAEDLGRFVRLFENAAPVLSAIPGGGWLIECTDDEGVTWTDPIMAWTIHADGTAIPIGVDSDGVTDDATQGLASYRIYHPSSTTPVPKDAPRVLPQRPGEVCQECFGSTWIGGGSVSDPNEPLTRCSCFTARQANSDAPPAK